MARDSDERRRLLSGKVRKIAQRENYGREEKPGPIGR